MGTLLGKYDEVAANVRLHRGWFDASLPAFLAREMAVGEVALPLHVSFLHIDCDLYSSTYHALDWLATHGLLEAGTILGYDDWSTGGAGGQPAAGVQVALRVRGLDARRGGVYTSMTVDVNP